MRYAKKNKIRIKSVKIYYLPDQKPETEVAF